MRYRLWTAWEQWGAVLMIAALAAVFVLGFAGVTSYAALNELDIPLSTRLYITASLFLLENGALDGRIPWTLDVARWAAPAVLATAAIGTVVSLLRHRAWSWGARRLSGHVVVVGLGDRGLQVAASAKRAGHRVVAIESDPENPHIRSVRRRGIPVVVGSASETSRLRTARLDRAARMHVLVGGPAETTAVAAAVARFHNAATSDPTSPFTCFLALDDADAARDLNALTFNHGTHLYAEFFSFADRAGPAVVDRWSGPAASALEEGPIVVIGASSTARSIVTAVARAQGSSSRAPEVHWVIRDRTRAVARALNDLAAVVSAAASVTPHLLTEPDARTDVAALVTNLPVAPSLVVVAETDSAEALSLLATADQALRSTDTRLVCVTEGESLLHLLEDHERIEIFDIARELIGDQQIANGRLEALGRALHDGYLHHLNVTASVAERARKPAYRSWATLPDHLRNQNYDAARAAQGMLRELGFEIVPRTHLLPAVTTFEAEAVESLAHAEHIRWLTSRNPNAPAPDWSAVEPIHAEQSRDQARRLPDVLAAADLQITPTVRRVERPCRS